MLINIIGALIVFCAGLFVGLKIKQKAYVALINNWSTLCERMNKENHEQLVMIIETFEEFYDKYKALTERQGK